MNILEKRVLLCLKNYNNRKIVIWGGGSNLTRISNYLQNYGLYAEFIVDSNDEKCDKENTIYNTSVLHAHKNEYYVIVSISKFLSEIIDQLKKYGYEEGEDFSYLSVDQNSERKEYPADYCDEFGNQIIGELKGALISFRGTDSKIKVGEGFYGKGLKIDVYSDVELKIGDNVKAVKNTLWIFQDTVSCTIGNDCAWWSEGSELVCFENTICTIGNDVRINENCKMIMPGNTFLSIGDGCIFGKYVTIRTNDGHPIYDIKTGRQLNDARSKKRGVVIRDHVWIGQDVIILYNSDIGVGSIVGAKSLTKGKYPNNCIIAGVPARIIKSDIAWNNYQGKNGIYDVDERYRQLTEENQLSDLGV